MKMCYLPISHTNGQYQSVFPLRNAFLEPSRPPLTNGPLPRPSEPLIAARRSLPWCCRWTRFTRSWRRFCTTQNWTTKSASTSSQSSTTLQPTFWRLDYFIFQVTFKKYISYELRVFPTNIDLVDIKPHRDSNSRLTAVILSLIIQVLFFY